MCTAGLCVLIMTLAARDRESEAMDSALTWSDLLANGELGV